jgi:hypothetical protein
VRRRPAEGPSRGFPSRAGAAPGCTAPDSATFGSVHNVNKYGTLKPALRTPPIRSRGVLPVISKSEFARALGVGRSAVGNMISRGQISGDALVERGGRILVDADVAREQLRGRLDVRQRLANGRARLDGDREAPTADPDPVMSKLKSARLRQAELAIQKSEAEAAERTGRFVLAADMRTEIGRIAGAMVASVEGGLAELANAVSLDTGASQRDVLVALRRGWRDLRTRLAGVEAEAAEAAANEPKTLEAAQ